MIVTLYKGARTNEPGIVADVTWPELAKNLAELAVHDITTASPRATPEDQKKALVAFSPVRLRPGATRSADAVEAITALALDVDDGTDPAAIVARLRELGHAALIYTSPTDTPAKRKFRVVAPITRELHPEECASSRQAFAEALGLGVKCGVDRCLNADRIFFAGRIHGTPARKAWNVPGAPVDVDALPQPALAWAAAKAPAAAMAPLATLPPGDAGLVAAIGDWTLHAGRKWDLCGALGGLMRKLAFTRQQCEAAIRAWLPPPGTPGVDVQAGVAWALGAFAEPVEEVSGYGALAAVVGEQHAQLIAGAATAASPIGIGQARRREAREWKPVADADSPAPESPLGPRYLMSDALPPIEWYCEALCLAPIKGKISLIAGAPGAGKGPIADHLAVCFALGEHAFRRWPCRQSRVVVLDSEGVALTHERLCRIALAMGHAPAEFNETLAIHDTSDAAFMTPAFFEALEALQPEVVIVDSYTSAMLTTEADPNKPEWALLAKWLGKLGCLVIAVAHSNKSPAPGERPHLRDIAGNAALAALAYTGIAVWHPDESARNQVSVGCMRSPRKDFESFDVTFRDTVNNGLELSIKTAPEARRDEADGKAARLTVLAGRVLAFMRENPSVPFAQNKIREGTGIHPRDVGQIVPALHRAGVLAYEASVKGHPRYVLRGDAPQSVAFGADGEVATAALDRRESSVAGFNRPPTK